ncbi:MAG: hypothetical protein WHT45_13045 [Ignavibacterium sp.]
MKQLLIITAFSTLILQGCYTVIMTPEDKKITHYDLYGYYPIEYYGDYGNYYDMPWWYSSPVVSVGNNQIIQRSSDTKTVRNENGDRTNTESRDGIISTPPPTRDIGSSTSGSGTSKSNGNSNNEVRSNNSSGNSNSGSIRNENGNRNSGNSRR